MENKNEWVIHVWGKERKTLELTDVEKFNIDLIGTYKESQKIFDRIIVNIALWNVNDNLLFNFLSKEISKVLICKNVVFTKCQNNSKFGEYVTFRPYVFDRIGENVNIFYSHFKGYHSCLKIKRQSFPTRVVDMSEMFWSYMMYHYSLCNPKKVLNKLNDEEKCIYAWFVLKEEFGHKDYYNEYQICLRNGNIDFDRYIEDEYSKHSPGSFCWYNMKTLGDKLRDKHEIRNISTEYLIQNSDEIHTLCTHFCELYLMQFLRDDDIYSVNDFNEEWLKMNCNVYSDLYPIKKIGVELIDTFEKYLIINDLI